MTKKKVKRFFVFAIMALLLGFFITRKSNLPEKKADVIIVLGTSPNPDKEPNPILKFRIDKGIELYKKGYAPKIIVTGTKVAGYYESEVMKEYCIEQGISSEDVIEENKAKNTIENALFSTNLMKDKGFTSGIVVSSRTHIKRSKFLFNRYDYDFQYVPANQDFLMYFMSLPVYIVEEIILLKTKKDMKNKTEKLN